MATKASRKTRPQTGTSKPPAPGRDKRPDAKPPSQLSPVSEMGAEDESAGDAARSRDKAEAPRKSGK